MRKLVRTPPTSTATVAGRGKPLCSAPTSEVVPPMSTTIASADAGQERRAANRIGRPAGEGEHREPLGVGRVHQRAVVLA